MLVLRSIADSISNEMLEQNPEEPDLPYIGSLSLVEYRSISGVLKHPRGFKIGFFEDTRLDSQELRVLLEICQECQQELLKAGNLGNMAYSNLYRLLMLAVERGEGILFLCD